MNDSILTMTIANQLADDACGPVWGSQIHRDTKRGNIARAARSAACSALICHIGDVKPGSWRYDAPGFTERLAEARSVAAAAFDAEVVRLKGRAA